MCMDRGGLKMRGFERIGEWILNGNNNLNYNLEQQRQRCVYAFVLSDYFGRLKGCSDILYIGKTEQGLESRLKEYKNHSGETNKRVRRALIKLLESGYRVYIYAKETNDAGKEEEKLLKMYENDHLELPPLNRQRGKKEQEEEQKVKKEQEEEEQN